MYHGGVDCTPIFKIDVIHLEKCHIEKNGPQSIAKIDYISKWIIILCHPYIENKKTVNYWHTYVEYIYSSNF